MFHYNERQVDLNAFLLGVEINIATVRSTDFRLFFDRFPTVFD